MAPRGGILHHGERLNTFTHAVGAGLSAIGLATLSAIAWSKGDLAKLAAFGIYGASLVLLYMASALYHGAKAERTKAWLRKIDHVSIYLLIAGSYTPIAMHVLHGAWGAAMLWSVWSLAALGIAQELTIGMNNRKYSLPLYVFMGCLAAFAAKPLLESLPFGGLAWLLGAGAAYLGGIYFYQNDHRKHFHGIWHLFVMAGSLCHFMCLLLYVA